MPEAVDRPLVTVDVTAAIEALRRGDLVAVPTETVYGLGADATNRRAVARVYATKGRPADHPLIVHLADAAELSQWAQEIPEYAQRLADELWPGPLTLVLKRTAKAGDFVTGGQDTVGLRVPAHALTRAIIAGLGPGAGVAAPSANRFGRVSPTTAAHVIAELGAHLHPGDLVLDGGPAEVGLESTIVDATGPAPVILRPGGISAEQVSGVGLLPVVDRDTADARPAVRAPGMLASHYAPSAQVALFESVEAWNETRALGLPVAAVGLLALASVETPAGVVRLSAPQMGADYARVLYAALREADALGLSRIEAILPDRSTEMAAAIRDRLTRAAVRDS